MKLFVVLALVAVTAAAPQSILGSQQRPQRQSLLERGLGAVAEILGYESSNDGSGRYRYSYEQSDGRKQSEEGELRNAGTDNEAIAVKGSYAWVGPDGVTYIVNYIADDNGYQPNIEQGPGGAVPAAIIASLAG